MLDQSTVLMHSLALT